MLALYEISTLSAEIMYYSQDIALWGVVAHIPLAIIFLMFLSRIVTLRDRDSSLSQSIAGDSNRKIFRRMMVGCLFGFVVLGLLSPASRFVLS